jgi:hypothetical protein
MIVAIAEGGRHRFSGTARLGYVAEEVSGGCLDRGHEGGHHRMVARAFAA